MVLEYYLYHLESMWAKVTYTEKESYVQIMIEGPDNMVWGAPHPSLNFVLKSLANNGGYRMFAYLNFTMCACIAD